MQAVIIAGGQGTRLSPLTYGSPKPMLPLIERPFLAWMVERCRNVGVTDILMNVHYQAHQIEAYFGDGNAFGVHIRYIHEESALGTAGAMKLAEPYFTGVPLVVFNADILTDLDLRQLMQVHQQTQSRATIALTRVDNPTAFGLVELLPPTEEQARTVVAFREKPTAEEAEALQIGTINAGTYILEPEIFATYQTGMPLSFERTIFPDLLTQKQKVSALIWDGYWQDLGTPAKYYQGQLDILTGLMPYDLTKIAQEKAPQVWVSPSAKIDPAAQLEGPSYLGDGVILGPNAAIAAGTLVGQNSLIDRPLSPGMYTAGTMAIKL
jgi:mannose-1-phosphate guanylyltransferase